MTRLFCCLVCAACWLQIRWYIPADWRADYDEPPRLCGAAAGPVSDPYLLVPVSILFYLSPDVFIAFCVLQCAYTDAICNTVEDQWIVALLVYGLVRGPHPAAALAPLALWLVMALLAAPFDCGVPVGMADAKLFSALGFALGRPMLLIPYPKGASRGDQILNAQSLEKRGLCNVLLQENMTEKTLVDAIRKTWADREPLIRALREAPPADGTGRVLEMIEEVQKK